MVTLSSVLVLVGVLAVMAILARLFILLANAPASATQITPTQRAERILRLEHETGVVEKHNKWEGCKRCHPQNQLGPPRGGLRPPKAAIVKRGHHQAGYALDARYPRYDSIEQLNWPPPPSAQPERFRR